MVLDLDILNKDRDWIIKNLIGEGVTGLFKGYQNIHLIPMFKNKVAYGENGFPWQGLEDGKSNREYYPGLCPIAEELHNKSFIGLNLCAHFFLQKEKLSL